MIRSLEVVLIQIYDFCHLKIKKHCIVQNEKMKKAKRYFSEYILHQNPIFQHEIEWEA